MRNIYMGNGNYFEDLENKNNKKDRNIIRPELNVEEIFKTKEINFNVSEELQKDIFNNLNKHTNYSSGYNTKSIEKQANKLVDKIVNYCDEVLPAQTIKEIEDKFKEDDVECEYVYFDITYIRLLNLLRNIKIDDTKSEKLNKISLFINYLESKQEIKKEYLITAHQLKQEVLSLNEIEEGLVHYVFKLIETYF